MSEFAPGSQTVLDERGQETGKGQVDRHPRCGSVRKGLGPLQEPRQVPGVPRVQRNLAVHETGRPREVTASAGVARITGPHPVDQ